MQFLDAPTRNLFFTGKGGVGKTSMACATAVQLADRGLRVLLVSTDPASNLDEVLGTQLANEPRAIESVPGLFAMNIDPEEAAREYRERMVGPYRGVLPDTAVASMEEQFSGSCTLEIAAFDEFAKLLGDKDATSHFDVSVRGTHLGGPRSVAGAVGVAELSGCDFLAAFLTIHIRCQHGSGDFCQRTDSRVQGPPSIESGFVRRDAANDPWIRRAERCGKNHHVKSHLHTTET